ncbi:MAG: ComEC/Rec2 family competence protein [Elainellaceae cyanobacterium]
MVNPGYIICLAYLAGLLLSGLLHGWLYGLGLGAIATFSLPWVWRYGPQRLTLVTATLVSVAAGAYLQLRTPSPTLYNISQWVSANAEISCITGTLQDSPQLTRRGKLKVQLNATQIEISGASEDTASSEGLTDASRRLLSDPLSVDGRLYVTLPLLQGTGLYPTQPVRACGQLYAPQPAQNPSGFDFAAYLARQSIFAGLQATTVEPTGPSTPPLLWQLRQRIVHAFVEPLGSPKGVLLSAMVLGRRAVDLPYDVRDPFSQVGLAHILAASGFHVSLLLGLFLVVTQRLSSRVRLGLGTVLLLGYAGLTGLQPSILRAVAMGVAVLLGNTIGRKTRPVGLLLAIATVILLVNPIWVWNLGFQLSFLATLGLLVTTRPLTQRLDWLPTPMATALAVPMAAIAWTLPIQLWAFSTLSPYSLPLNVMVTPLISLISLVGMADAAIALAFPDIASVIAQALSLPIQVLMASVTWADQLPGRTLALGQSLIQVGLIYTAFGVISLVRPRQQMMLGVLVLGLLLVPSWWMQRHLIQVTVLAGQGPQTGQGPAPTVVVQERGLVGVMGDSGASDLSFGLLPFLRRQGVNHVDWAVDLSGRGDQGSDWLPELPIQQRYGLTEDAVFSAVNGATWAVGDTLSLGTAALHLLSVAPVVLDLTVANQHWLVVGQNNEQIDKQGDETNATSYGWPLGMTEQASPGQTTLPQGVLVWSGRAMPPQWLTQLRVDAAIATSATINPEAASQLQQQAIPIHIAGQSGAIQWQPGMAVSSLVGADTEF